MASERRHQEDELESDASYPKWPRILGIPSHDAVTHRDYTIAWICALPLELAASRAMLNEEHPVPPNQVGDDNTYVLGRIGQHNVVMVCLPGQYGTNNAAIVSTNLKRSFPSIRGALMVGVGGGCPTQADLNLGDVVVGTRVMQYDMGKVVAGGDFLETADAKTPAPLLNSAVSCLRSNMHRTILANGWQACFEAGSHTSRARTAPTAYSKRPMNTPSVRRHVMAATRPCCSHDASVSPASLRFTTAS
jgi:nucleoside phosphorylase